MKVNRSSSIACFVENMTKYMVLCEVIGCVCCHLFMVRLKTARRNVTNVLRSAGTSAGDMFDTYPASATPTGSAEE